jgi:excisionase family DNA binding protein
MMEKPENITTNEAASVLGVTRQRVLQLIQDGRLKAEKFGNVYMIRRGDLAHIESLPMGRPPKSAPATQKTATGAAGASNGGVTGKKKDGSRKAAK